MAALQRLQQGVRALLAFSQDVDYELAAQYLNVPQMTLFRQMTRTDQLHVLNVLRDVLAADRQANRSTPHDLAVAALLHDAGKGRYHLSLPEKTFVVLVRAFLPALYETLSQQERLNTWHAAFAVYRYHAKWSAEMLQPAGASERAIWLAAHHQDDAETWHAHPHYDLLCRLQRADDAN